MAVVQVALFDAPTYASISAAAAAERDQDEADRLTAKAAMCVRRGDIIAIRLNAECPEPPSPTGRTGFLRLSFSRDLRKYKGTQRGERTNAKTDRSRHRVDVRRSLWRVDLDRLSARQLADLMAKREITIADASDWDHIALSRQLGKFEEDMTAGEKTAERGYLPDDQSQRLL